MGESHLNDDGTARQSIIARLSKGNVVRLVREPENRFDHNAVAVVSRFGCIGYLGRDHAKAVAFSLDSGAVLKAEISGIFGGTPEQPTRGVWIWIWDDPTGGGE